MALVEARSSVVFKLYDFQSRDVEEILRLFREGAKHAALFYCTGAGKSGVGLCIAGRLLTSGDVTHVVVAAPTITIRDTFEFKENCAAIIDMSGRHVPPIVETKEGAALSRYLQSDSRSIARTTHTAVRQLLGTPALLSCAGKLLILDEAHHAAGPRRGRAGRRARANVLRELRDKWLAAGGLVLSLTATPELEDAETIPKDVPARRRTMPRQMAEGFAPKYLLNDLVVVEGTEGQSDEETLYCPLDEEKTAATLVQHMRAEASNGAIKAILRVRNAGAVNKHGGGGWKGNHEMMVAAARALRRDGKRVFIASKAHDRSEDVLEFNQVIFADVHRRCAARGLAIPYDDTFTLIRWYEGTVGDVRDSCVDVIIGIQEVLEGFDWPPCCHVYFLGVPCEVPPLVQGIGRAMRLRKDHDTKQPKFVGYAPYWMEHSKVVFLVSDPRARRDQVRLVFNVCAYLSTFRQWSLLDAMAPIFKKLGDSVSQDTIERIKDEIEDKFIPSQRLSARVEAMIALADQFFRDHVDVSRQPSPFDRADFTLAYAVHHGKVDARKEEEMEKLRKEILDTLYFRTPHDDVVGSIGREIANGVDPVAATGKALEQAIERFRYEVQPPNGVEAELEQYLIRLGAEDMERAGEEAQRLFESPDRNAGERRLASSFISLRDES